MRNFLALVWMAVFAVHAGTGYAQITAGEGAEATFRAYYDQAEMLQENVGVPSDVERGLEIHKELAEAGYAPSMYQLGKAYYYGEGADADIATAVRYFDDAVTAGDTNAMVWLGRSLLESDGGAARAFEVLNKAATLGIAGAEFRLGLGHVNGMFGEFSDPQAGLEILRKLHAAGDGSATYALGLALRSGGNVEPDPAEARQLFLALAELGHAKSAERLGEMMSLGEGGAIDADGAAKYFELAWLNGRESAALKLADALIAANRGPEAREVLVAAAGEGSEDARLNLALGDVTGAFGTASDPVQGSVELAALTDPPSRRTADQLAKYVLNNGLPAEVDLNVVVEALETAASDGDATAAVRLLRLYRQRPDLFPDAVARREAALEAYGPLMSSRAFVGESIRLIGETSYGRQAGEIMADILQNADAEAVQRGLFAAFQSDRNAYVYLIQGELTERGLYSGRLNGIADAATIRAILAYCAKLEITDVCAAGPLRKEVAKAFSSAIAEGV